jgi:hypothetical protein
METQTKIFLILEENKLKIHECLNRETGKIEPLKFEDYETANEFANIHSDIWQVIEVNFNSKRVKHEPNMTGTFTTNIFPVSLI